MNPTSSPTIPANLDATAFANIEPIFRELLERELLSTADFERWLIDRSELSAACGESGANLYIAMTCDTDDKAAASAYRDFIEQVLPKTKPLDFALDQRHVELTSQFDLDANRFAVLNRDTETDVALFREENIPIETKLDTLSQDFQTITGAMTVQFDGKEQTMPQMGRYQETSDRTQREAAWRASADRRLQDVDQLNTIYDEMISLRHNLSVNAGFENYIGFTFKAKHRFDYTPTDCHSYHDACEQFVAPFARRRGEERLTSLGIDTLRPWDVVVDPLGRDALTPFEGGAELVAKSASTFTRLDPRLAEMFATLGDGSTAQGARDGVKLDLDSRKGKAPGGYQYMRDRIREPFIFMNAAGLHRDVETMIHEAGHAFHSILCRDEPLLHYRHSTIEFAEVASMSMELLSMPYWGGQSDSFYPDEADADRARRRQLEGSITMLGWIATIDAFQHWIYANPEHTQDQRAQHWRSLIERFGAMGHFVSWDGIETHRDSFWQRQSHLFSVPFYYIEYGIAQLGAMQLWLRSLEEGEEVAIASYMKALQLGGSVPLPDLFEAAGLEFNFGPSMVQRIVTRVESELAKLPV